MVVAVVLGLTMELVGLSPIKALFVSALLQGVLAPFLVALITHMADSQEIVSPAKPNGLFDRVFGWFTALLMAIAAAAMIWSSLFG